MYLATIMIEELELGVRAYNILKRMGVNNSKQLAELTVQELNDYTNRTGIAVGLPAFNQMVAAVHELRAWSV